MAKTEKRFLTKIMRLNLLDSGSKIRSHLYYAFSGADWTTRWWYRLLIDGFRRGWGFFERSYSILRVVQKSRMYL